MSEILWNTAFFQKKCLVHRKKYVFVRNRLFRELARNTSRKYMIYLRVVVTIYYVYGRGDDIIIRYHNEGRIIIILWQYLMAL